MIRVEGITKRYGKHTAVDCLDFCVEKGEILGFLGPNGAGKSTTMNIITGYISATEGKVVVDGFDILEQPEQVKRRIGYLPEFPPLYGDMTPKEFLHFICEVKGIGSPARRQEIERVSEMLSITEMLNRLIMNLSRGFKQRVGLAQALIGDPKVLILDEPTSGLDPQQIIEMRNLIQGLGGTHTIMLSSHILSEVSTLCDRVIIINRGKIVAIGTPQNLSKRVLGLSKLALRVAGPEEKVLPVIRNISGVHCASIIEAKEADAVDIVVETEEGKDIRRTICFALSELNLPILQMRSGDVSLEEIFLQLTAGNGEGSI